MSDGRIDTAKDCWDWVRREALTMSVQCRVHPLAALRPGLAKEGFTKAEDLCLIRNGAIVKVAGLSVIVHTPPTKSGIRAMFVTMEDETGLMDLAVFPDVQETAARRIMTGRVIALEGELKRAGYKGRSISITARRLIREWTGSLEKVIETAEKEIRSVS